MNSSDLTKMEGLSGMHLRKALRVCDQVTDLNTTTSLRLQIANLLNELGEKTQAVQLLTSIWTVLRTRLDAGESLSSIEDALQTALDSGKSLDSLSTSGVKLFGGIIDLARDLDQIKLMQETFDYAKEYINLHRSNFELYDPDLLIAELVAKSGRPDEALQLVKGYLGIVSADGVYRAIFDVFLANGEFDKAYEIIKSCDSWNWVALLVDLAKADARFYAEAEEYLNSSYTENLEMVEHHKDTVVRIPKSL
ncbi:MAG: hypothetical protein Q6361_03715, partial [Candidatus Hermodarchaeota archaeon]|nr:hypothetical protein [Candidatus Hermodarchaeota archaeon]